MGSAIPRQVTLAYVRKPVSTSLRARQPAAFLYIFFFKSLP